MNELQLDFGVVHQIARLYFRQNTLKYFYSCFADNSEKRKEYLQELAEVRLKYNNAVNDILVKYGVTTDDWHLDFITGILQY